MATLESLTKYPDVLEALSLTDLFLAAAADVEDLVAKLDEEESVRW